MPLQKYKIISQCDTTKNSFIAADTSGYFILEKTGIVSPHFINQFVYLGNNYLLVNENKKNGVFSLDLNKMVIPTQYENIYYIGDDFFEASIYGQKKMINDKNFSYNIKFTPNNSYFKLGANHFTHTNDTIYKLHNHAVTPKLGQIKRWDYFLDGIIVTRKNNSMFYTSDAEAIIELLMTEIFDADTIATMIGMFNQIRPIDFETQFSFNYKKTKIVKNKKENFISISNGKITGIYDLKGNNIVKPIYFIVNYEKDIDALYVQVEPRVTKTKLLSINGNTIFESDSMINVINKYLYTLSKNGKTSFHLFDSKLLLDVAKIKVMTDSLLFYSMGKDSILMMNYSGILKNKDYFKNVENWANGFNGELFFCETLDGKKGIVLSNGTYLIPNKYDIIRHLNHAKIFECIDEKGIVTVYNQSVPCLSYTSILPQNKLMQVYKSHLIIKTQDDLFDMYDLQGKKIFNQKIKSYTLENGNVIVQMLDNNYGVFNIK
jgi:hypothetical protein